MRDRSRKPATSDALPARYATPILKWAGGKAVFVREIVKHVPALRKDARYYEPFAGAASLFLALRPRKARLSDLNKHLMDTYRSVRAQPIAVAKRLRSMAQKHRKSFYYEIREAFNRSRSPLSQAVRFIYLNSAGFNGVYRVNTAGKFNVPHGKRRKLKLPTVENIELVAKSLRRAQLRSCSYVDAVADAKRGDFVYLDPPYPPLNGSSFFTHYTKERFGSEDQENVAALAKQLKRRGVRVLITNADTPLIRKLYKGWRIRKVSRPRWVRSGNVKHQVNELIIVSYKQRNASAKRTTTRVRR